MPYYQKLYLTEADENCVASLPSLYAALGFKLRILPVIMGY